MKNKFSLIPVKIFLCLHGLSAWWNMENKMARSIYGKKNYGYNEVNINQNDKKQT